jgi:energy-converting hydrogenase Eha subunit A
MGIFNFFIVIPEILASLALEPIVKGVFGNDPVKVVMLGGASMLIAAIVTQFVEDVPTTEERMQRAAEEERMLTSAVPPESPLA